MSWLLISASLFCAGVLCAIGLTATKVEKGATRIQVPVAAPTPEGSKCTPCFRPETDGSEPRKQNTAPNVTELAVSKTELQLPCSDQSYKADDTVVEVITTAEDADGDVLTYNYTVSGGRVVGTGRQIHWSFLGIKAGTYSITAGVDDGCGICGRTETKLVKVLECSTSE